MARRTNAGELNVDLRLDDGQFTRALRRGAKTVEGFGGTIGKIAAGNILAQLPGQLLGLAKRFNTAAQAATTWGATLVEQASITGISTTRLDLLRRAFEANGASITQVDNALAKFNRRLNFAANGQEEYARVFRQLRLDPSVYSDTEEALRDTINAISELSTASERGAAAFRLFGTSAQSIQKTINDGLPALDREIERQRELGIITEKQASDLKIAAQSYTDLKNVINIQTRVAVAGLTEEINLLAKAMILATRAGAGLLKVLLAYPSFYIDFYSRTFSNAVTDLGEWQRAMEGATEAIEEQGPAVTKLEESYYRAREEFRLWQEEARKASADIAMSTPLPPIDIIEVGIPSDRQISQVLATWDMVGQESGKSYVEAIATILGAGDGEGLDRILQDHRLNVLAGDHTSEGLGLPDVSNNVANAEGAVARYNAQMARARELADLQQAAWITVGMSVSDVVRRSETFGDVLKNLGKEIAALAVGFLAFLGGGGQGGILAFLGGAIPGNQYGGPAYAGRPYIVGERGPELFVPNYSGQVVRNEDMAARSGRSVVINNTANTTLTGPQFIQLLVDNQYEVQRILNPQRRLT